VLNGLFILPTKIFLIFISARAKTLILILCFVLQYLANFNKRLKNQVMRNLLVLMLAVSGGLCAQKNSCCSISVTDKNAMLAMNEEFAKTHLAPEPFKFENGQGAFRSFKTPDGMTGRAYVIKAEKPTDKVLFVFHEWWGLNDYIKQEAEKWKTELGDVDVYAIDLYDGEVATTTDEAQKLMGSMKEERAKAIIQGAIESLNGRAKIATIGWCFGGAWSLQAALLASKHAVGCVMYYGMPEQDLKKLKTLHCDVLGIFGTQDKFINPDVVKTFEGNMLKAGKRISVHSYDANHAFANPSNPKYNKQFAEDAHQKALVYLKDKFR
jgi:carboxymethylenebutenolidase